jgi:hypothetical protein
MENFHKILLGLSPSLYYKKGQSATNKTTTTTPMTLTTLTTTQHIVVKVVGVVGVVNVVLLLKIVFLRYTQSFYSKEARKN